MRSVKWLLCLLLLIGANRTGATTPEASLPLAPGRYVFTLTTHDVGRVQLLVDLQLLGDTLLLGTTTPELPKRLIGGPAALLLRQTLPDNGALLRVNLRPITSPRPSRLRLVSQGTYDVLAQPVDAGAPFRAELRHPRSGQVVGELEVVPTTQPRIRSDYASLAERVVALAEEKLYNPALLTGKPWRRYRRGLLESAKQCVDDGDLLFASLYWARQLPFSHFGLFGDKQNQSPVRSLAPPPPSVRMVSPLIALLDLPSSTLRAATVDSLMAVVRANNAQALIIDLRRNRGGDMETGMRLLQHLTDRPLFGGIMLSQRWWRQHQRPPTAEETAGFPVMSRASYAEFRAQRHQVEGLALRIPLPEAAIPRFTGRVVVLVSHLTASAAEPIAFGIQYYQLGTVVGERTAGAVLSMEEVAVDRYTLQVPMLSYYAPDGRELDQVGVVPAVAVPADQALDKALTQLAPP